MALDCNCNGVLDDQDITNGTSADVDGDVIPDECEESIGTCCTLAGTCNVIPEACCIDVGGSFVGGLNTCDDCNENQFPDTCDIASGASDDCDFNGVPDECQGMFVPKGACCFGDTCVMLMECECADQGGIWVGDGSNCRSPQQCQQYSAPP